MTNYNKKIKQIFLLTALVLIFGLNSYAKKAYEIKVKINGISDTALFLGNYYGKYQFSKDTAAIDKNDLFVFEGDKPLAPGLYFIALPNKSYFEIIINKEQKFSMETDIANFVKHMKFKNCEENQLFYEYLQYAGPKQEEAMKLQTKLKTLQSKQDSLKIVEEKIKFITDELNKSKAEFIEKNPKLFASILFKASTEPEVPEAPLLENGKTDENFAYEYYKSHYFDNINLQDDRLLRSPILYNKVNYYLDKMIVQRPDTIFKECSMMIEKSRGNKEMFKYLVWYCTYKYETSTLMGFDEVFVNLVETYYTADQATWLSPKQLENIQKSAIQLKALLLGKVAPNMIMMDTSNQLVSLHHINAKYIVVNFWDTDCGHCKNEIPHMRNFYNANKEKYDMEVFAVCSDTSLVKWKEFIKKENLNWINVNGPRSATGNYHDQYNVITTPMIYLLDENKKIIAKRITPVQLADILKREEEDMK